MSEDKTSESNDFQPSENENPPVSIDRQQQSSEDDEPTEDHLIEKRELLLLDKHLGNFSFFSKIARGDDPLLLMNGLMWELYKKDIFGGEMTVGEACDHIPAQHTRTCKKYLKLAENEKLVVLRTHPRDKRKTVVMPTNKLRKRVRQEMKQQKKMFEMLLRDYEAFGDEKAQRQDGLSGTI